MKKLTVSSLNALFDFLNQQTDTILWIRSLDYGRQLYLSQNFDKFFPIRSEQMYERPESWNDCIFQDDQNRVVSNLQDRLKLTPRVSDDIAYYRVIDSANQMHFLRGTTYLLTENDKPFAFAGLTSIISESQWLQDHTQPNSSEKNPLKDYLFHILHAELNLKPNDNIITPTCCVLDKGIPVRLTPMEQQCLELLALGKSAKESAEILTISARTVEFHLNNIKRKSNSKTKLILLSKTQFT